VFVEVELLHDAVVGLLLLAVMAARVVAHLVSNMSLVSELLLSGDSHIAIARHEA